MPPDLLKPDLRVVFVGISNSAASGGPGHYYANPDNRFWDLLHATGLAGEEWIHPSDDVTVLERGIGLTDLVPALAASSDPPLRSGDFDIPRFFEKLAEFKPRIIAFNGGYPARRVARHLRHPPPPEGPLDWPVAHSVAYRLPSSASDTAADSYATRREKWVSFGDWARKLTAIGDS